MLLKAYFKMDNNFLYYEFPLIIIIFIKSLSSDYFLCFYVIIVFQVMLQEFNVLIYVSITCANYLIVFQYFWPGSVYVSNSFRGRS